MVLGEREEERERERGGGGEGMEREGRGGTKGQRKRERRGGRQTDRISKSILLCKMQECIEKRVWEGNLLASHMDVDCRCF